jgi:CRISPR-associated protein Cmr4
LANLSKEIASLIKTDPIWEEVEFRLVILSNGMMSYFAQSACEIAQHVRINDETGTAEPGALFNQENVPSESLFYSVVHAFDERAAGEEGKQLRQRDLALETFAKKIKGRALQFGGDASTGLGYCDVTISSNVNDNKEEA